MPQARMTSLQESALARKGQKVYERLWVTAKNLQGRAKIFVSFYQVGVAVPGTYLVYPRAILIRARARL